MHNLIGDPSINVRGNDNLLGISTVCVSTTITLHNSQNIPVQWSVTGNFTLSNATNTSVVVTKTGTGADRGTITAQLQGCGAVTRDLTSCSLIISGPTHVCAGSSYTFTVTNPPPGFNWGVSSNLTINGPANNSTVTVTKSGGNGPGTVYIMLNGSQLVSYNVYAGTPVLALAIEGPSTVQNSQINTFEISSITGGFIYTWSGPPNVCGIQSTYSLASYNSAQVYFSPPGDRWLDVYASNACGSSPTVRKYVTVIGFGGPDTLCSMAYPNPATNILNIEINPAAVKAKSVGQATTLNAKQLQTDLTYDIRLYDGQGNLLRQKKTKGGTVQFNVASLPAGIYYLHIYDGVNGTPEMRQIVVER